MDVVPVPPGSDGRAVVQPRVSAVTYRHGAAVLPTGSCSHGQEPVLGARVAGKEGGDSEPWPQRCPWGIGDCGKAPR